MSNHLTVCGVTIKQDAEGRYCLNDLHKAAGAENRHQSAFFLKRPETVELVNELANSSSQKNIEPVSSSRGRLGGTFVVKELVYAYAMWISAKFHLEVIRSYDRLATEGVAVHKDSAEEVLANPQHHHRSFSPVLRERPTT
jgi:hypothetical protein